MNKQIKEKKIAFWGSPEIALTVLEKLKEGGLIPNLIITQSDKRQGRKMLLTPPPVKTWAEKNNVDFSQPEKLDKNFIDFLKKEDWDLFILVAYGKIISKEILNIPKKGILNLHPSLLPLYRGATPIHSTILNGDKESGVTIILLDEEMDHGDILDQRKITLWQEDFSEMPTQSELENKLAILGAELLLEIVPVYLEGGIFLQEQAHQFAIYCQKFKSEDSLIDLSDDPFKNFLKIKAFDKWPKAHYFENEKRVLIKDAVLENGKLKITKILKEGASKIEELG